MKQCSRPGLILQQQPACLLTALQGFTAALKPRGHFIWPHLSVSLPCPPCSLWPCGKRHYSIFPCYCQAWFSYQQRSPASQHGGCYYLFSNSGIIVWLKPKLPLELEIDFIFKFSIISECNFLKYVQLCISFSWISELFIFTWSQFSRGQAGCYLTLCESFDTFDTIDGKNWGNMLIVSSKMLLYNDVSLFCKQARIGWLGSNQSEWLPSVLKTMGWTSLIRPFTAVPMFPDTTKYSLKNDAIINGGPNCKNKIPAALNSHLVHDTFKARVQRDNAMIMPCRLTDEAVMWISNRCLPTT